MLPPVVTVDCPTQNLVAPPLDRIAKIEPTLPSPPLAGLLDVLIVSPAPTSSSNTGIRLLKSGKYKVSYTLNWQNTGTASRANFFSLLVKHSSAITPTETELAGSRSYGYLRNNTNATIATTTNVTVVDVDANEYIKCKTTVAKNDTTFDDNFADLVYHINSSIVIEFLGDI